MNFFSAVPGRPLHKQQLPSTARLVFKGILFEVWQWEQALFDGKKTVFESLRRPDTVLILPVLSDGRVILAEEKQPGMPSLLQALGGRVEPGESPEQAARRELLEESGYTAERFLLWDAWQPVTKIDWAVYLFVARGLSVTGAAVPDGGEAINLRLVPAAKLLDRDSDLAIDDYELLHKLYYARSCNHEYERVAKLLNIQIVP